MSLLRWKKVGEEKKTTALLFCHQEFVFTTHLRLNRKKAHVPVVMRVKSVMSRMFRRIFEKSEKLISNSAIIGKSDSNWHSAKLRKSILTTCTQKFRQMNSFTTCMRTFVTAITDPWVSYGCDMSKNVTNGCNKILFGYKLLL